MNGLAQVGQFILREGSLLAVLFLLISMAVSLLQQTVGQRLNDALVNTPLGIGTAVAAAAGAVTPFCSCSTVPILNGMLRAKIRFGICITFLIASPVINEGVLLVLVRQYSVIQAAVFVAVASGLAMTFGMLFDRLDMQRFVKLAPVASAGSAVRVAAGEIATVPLMAKLRTATTTAVNELRATAPYLIGGILVGAVIYGYVPQDAIVTVQGHVPVLLLIGLMAVAGVPFYVNATMIVPIAMALLLKGVSIGPVAAFLVSAAGTGIPEMILLTRLFKLPLIVSHVLSVVISATVIGLTLEWATRYL